MKIFEVSVNQTTEPEHGYFAPARGPNNTPGVELHYVSDLGQHHKVLRGLADEAGDTRWRENIDRMAGQYEKTGQKHTTPTLGWWFSEEDFHAGKEGFGGSSKDSIMGKFPDLTIHDSKEEAVQHAGY